MDGYIYYIRQEAMHAAWEGDYRLLVFTASNPGLMRIEAWIRGYHRGSEKGCGLTTPTQINTATLDTTPFFFKNRGF